MIPQLGEVREIEQLAASKTPSYEGAWWIMLQTAESICNYASRRDPINNAFLSEFWTEAAAEIEKVLESESERPFPYDDLMQMVSFCGNQLQNIIVAPRHNIVKVDKMVRTYRVQNTGSRTMNWLGKQPGKTIKEKLAGKEKMLTQVNEYSFDIRENQVTMMLYRQLMRRISDRVNYGIKLNGYDLIDSEQLDQFQKIRKQLRNSPLAEVKPQNHNQANNALLSDKNYSIVWRAYMDMAKFDKKLADNRNNALVMYVKSIFLAINAELLSYKDVYVVEERIKLNVSDMNATYILGYHWKIPYVVKVETKENTISLRMYDAPYNESDTHDYEMNLNIKVIENPDNKALVYKHGTPIIVKVEEGKKRAEVPIYADLSGIRSVTSFLMNKVFPFAGIDPEKCDSNEEYIEGSVSFDIVANGDFVGIENAENQVRDSFYAKKSVSYTDSNGIKTAYPGRDKCIHYKSDEQVSISDAIFYQNNEGLKAALSDISKKVIQSNDDYFFYLVPDALEEILQKNLKQAVRSSFARTFPVWRSVSAITYWLSIADTEFSDEDVFAYIDLAGEAATAGMLTIHEEKFLDDYACSHFPPMPQSELGESITETAFCSKYVEIYAANRGITFPEKAIDGLIKSGAIQNLILGDSYANYFMEEDDGPHLYQLEYDSDVLSECVEHWISNAKKFWKSIRDRFDREHRPNRLLLLSDVVISAFVQLEREDDIYEILDGDDISIYQSGESKILSGALVFKKRLNEHLPTWTEYLPKLSLEVIKDGAYAQLELVGDDVAFDVMGDDNEHAVEERLILKAGQNEYRFPLKKMDISRKSSKIDAYITDKSFPLERDLGVKLVVRYKYGYDNSFELVLAPEVEKDAPFKNIIVDWKEGIKKEKKSLYPIYPELTNYEKTLQDIENVKSRLQGERGVLNTIERFFVNYNSYNAHKCNLSKLGADLTKPIFTIRNIIVHDEIQEANDFVDWFYQSRIFILCAEIAQIFRNDNIPDIFFNEFWDNPKYANLVCSAMQLIYSFGQRTPKQLQDYLLKRYYKMEVPHKDNILLNMLYLNSDNNAIMDIILDESTDHNKMDSCIKEISSLCWFDSKMIYKLSEYPAFLKAIVSYITSELNAKREDAEKGKQYEDFKMKSQRKRYLRYVEMILAILRLREDPEFDLLVVDSREANSLAETIRIVDDFMGNPNSKIKLKVNKPQALCNMSDIAFAIDMYLTGDEGVDLIEVVSVDMD